MANLHCICICIHTTWEWASNHIRFSKAALFITGLILSEAFIELLFVAFLISYIFEAWKASLWGALALAATFDGIRYFLTIAIHHIAIDRLDHFRTIIITIPCLFLGLLVLWLPMFLSGKPNGGILYIALPLLTVGLAGENACLETLLSQQFEEDIFVVDQRRSERQQREDRKEYEDVVAGRASLWYYGARTLGKFICWTFPSSLDWTQRSMVSFIVVAAAYTLFICGRCYYERKTPTKRRVASGLKEAMGLVKLIPLWLLLIPYSLVEVARSSFYILQSNGLDTSINPRISLNSVNQIPVTSLYVFSSFISFLVSVSSASLIGKLWSNEEPKKQRAKFARIGVGMLFASGSSLCAWLVEVRRLKSIEEQGGIPIPMKILWLAPQFAFIGIANGLVQKGLRYLFYELVPESKWYFEVLFNLSVMGIGSFLTAAATLLARDSTGDTIDESRFDNYLQMLAILNIVVVPVYIFFFFFFDWNISGNNETEEVDGRDVEIEEVDGRHVEIL